MNMNELTTLTPEELNHPLWKKLERHMLEELNNNRRANDALNASMEQTYCLRGANLALKGLLQLNPDNQDI